jgi:hypothetical protein
MFDQGRDDTKRAYLPQNIGLFAGGGSFRPPNDGGSSPEIQTPEPLSGQDCSRNREFQKTELSHYGESPYQDAVTPGSLVSPVAHEQNQRPNASPTDGESLRSPFFSDLKVAWLLLGGILEYQFHLLQSLTLILATQAR